MKNIYIGIVASIILSVSCNNAETKTNSDKADTSRAQQPASTTSTVGTVPVKEIVSDYLQLKNALSNDNGNEAANGGKAIATAMQKFDTASLSSEQKKVYADIADDIKEHSEHIAMNGDKLAHQREHFEMLSRDIYDLVKKFPPGQILYKDYCPMYNNGKGATWISETKEIQNPYLGKKMPTCGEMKEEIK